MFFDLNNDSFIGVHDQNKRCINIAQTTHTHRFPDLL